MIQDIQEDWRWIVGIVSGGHFLSHFYMLAIPPLFPFLRADFGLSNAEFGLIISITAIGGLLQAPVGGIVDRIGAKWMFVTGIAVTAGGIILIGIGPSYLTIVALAVVTGIGQSTFHPAGYAILDTIAEPEHQGRAFSVHTFCGYGGAAVAPIVIGLLALSFGWRSALLAVGAVGVVYAAVVAVVLLPVYRSTIDDTQSEDSTADDQTILSSLLRPGLLAIFLFFLITAFASKGIQTFTPVLAIDSFDLSETFGSTLLSAYFGLGAIGVLFGGVFADRYAPSRVIAGSLAVGAALILLTVSGIVPLGALSLVGVFGLIGFFISLVSPARDQLVSRLSADGSMGKSFGVVFTGGTIGGLVGPTFLGVVGDATTIALVFVGVGILYLGAGGLAYSIGNGWVSRRIVAGTAKGD